MATKPGRVLIITLEEQAQPVAVPQLATKHGFPRAPLLRFLGCRGGNCSLGLLPPLRVRRKDRAQRGKLWSLESPDGHARGHRLQIRVRSIRCFGHCLRDGPPNWGRTTQLGQSGPYPACCLRLLHIRHLRHVPVRRTFLSYSYLDNPTPIWHSLTGFTSTNVQGPPHTIHQNGILHLLFSSCDINL